MKVGMIANRHNMPVNKYIINKKIPKLYLNTDSLDKLKNLVENEINIFELKYIKKKIKIIDLYLTGLNRVQILIIFNLKKKYDLNLYDYDDNSKKYMKILSIKKK